MKTSFVGCLSQRSLVAALALACFVSGCHSGRSKRKDAEPPTVTTARADPAAYPRLSPPVATAPTPQPQLAPTTMSAPAAEQASLTRPSIDPNAPARYPTPPLEQTVRFRVNAEEVKPITQSVALDVKFAKQPQLEVPLSLNVKMPSEAERKIPVVFSVDSSAPLVVPIRFQATGEVRTSSGITTGGGGGSELGTARDVSSSSQVVAAPTVLDSANIPIRLLAVVVGVAGLIGGTIRSLEARRVLKQRAAKVATRDVSKLTFDERVRLLDQEAQATRFASLACLFVANILWGILASALVPACLVVMHNPLLVQIGVSRAHALALFGFCLLAATVGAEFLALIQRTLQHAMSGADRLPPTSTGGTSTPFENELGKSPSRS